MTILKLRALIDGRAIAVAFLVLMAGALQAHAADLRVQNQPIEIHHQQAAAGVISVGDDTIGLDDNPVIRLRKGDLGKLYVRDSNPILFTYRMTEPEFTPTNNYQVIEEFAAALKKLMDVWAPSSELEFAAQVKAKPQLLIDDLNVAEFLNAVSKLLGYQEQSTAEIDRLLAEGNGEVQEVKSEIDSWKIGDLTRTIDDGLSKLEATRRNNINQVQSRYGIAIGSASSELGRANTLSEIPARIDEIRTSAADDDNGRPEGPVLSELAAQARLVIEVYDERRELRDAMALMNSFSERIGGVSESILLASIPYNNAQNRNQAFVVEANTEFDALLSRKAIDYRAKKLGKRPLSFSPYEHIKLSIAPGVLYSFVEDPEFSLGGESGDLIVRELNSDPAALSGAVALNITTSRYAGTGLEPFFQIGVVPESSNTGIFAGFGLHAYARATISAGVMYQEVTKLGSGLSVGDMIDNADDFRTDDTYETGLYVMIAVNLGSDD